MYRTYRIPKKNGKFRIISEPIPELKAMQHTILERLNTIPLMDCVHGFVPGRDIISNAKVHQQKRYVLNIDIKDFFPSIVDYRLVHRLRDLGVDNNLIEWVVTICFWGGGLPQGAPTSPVLANIYMKDIDVFLLGVAEEYSLSYTRYADDITFSGDEKLKELMPFLLELVDEVLRRYDLTRNRKKTKLMPYYQRQVVTGVVVNNERLTLSREIKERLFQELRGRPRNLLTDNELGYLEHVRHVDPKTYEKLWNIMI